MRSVSKVLLSNLRMNGLQARPLQSMQPLQSMVSNQSQHLFLQQFSYATQQEQSVKKEKKARAPKAEKEAKSPKVAKTSKAPKVAKTAKTTKTTTTSKTTKAGAKTGAKAKKAAVKKEKTFMESLKRSEKKLLEKFPDPNKPSRALSAFNLFVKDEVGDGVRIADAAQMWKNTSELVKQEYSERAKPGQEDYKLKKAQYKLIEDKSVAQWLEIIKQLKAEMPPQSGYTGFIKENKDLYKQGVGAVQVTKELSQKWKSLSEDQRRQYNDQYSTSYKQWKAKVNSYYE